MMVYKYFLNFQRSVDLMPVTWTDLFMCLKKTNIKNLEWFFITWQIITKHEEKKDLMPYFTDAYFFINMISHLTLLGFCPIIPKMILSTINLIVMIKILRCTVYGDLKAIPILSGLDFLLFLTRKKFCIEFEFDDN
ncbi:hypothetical protein NBO_639g0001 [Nosema bombycis CQ1]|uniref:Uncharacterized protein n=1 Tax=Nosema bombycis (strain CQ1 / CVCC 102059) TaxID=578461 RepID=R0MD13_NOSB1|nr:hypothetical protein NBO_639g0001 [Nosema bombycis CQ1]|eukprot:EOB11920.1 hypothetical protein NBO_639g0001 [Nosema bombycis CQ1]